MQEAFSKALQLTQLAIVELLQEMAGIVSGGCGCSNVVNEAKRGP
jgi:hypothetical protein